MQIKMIYCSATMSNCIFVHHGNVPPSARNFAHLFFVFFETIFFFVVAAKFHTTDPHNFSQLISQSFLFELLIDNQFRVSITDA